MLRQHHVRTVLLNSEGMTLPEALVAVALLAMFMALYVVMSNLLLAYLVEQQGATGANGSEQNQVSLFRVMDSWVEYLSQPGVSRDDLLRFSSCAADPVVAWGLPGRSMAELQDQEGIPINYRFCLRATPLVEADPLDLLSGLNGARPGLYALYSIPDSGTLARLPLRRLFCRPKPYC